VRAGFRAPTSTRAVQSAAAEIGTAVCVTTRSKASSSATSTVSCARSPRSTGRRVHKITLVGSGSPEATPSGKRSRRSFQLVREAAAAPPQASVAPIADARCMKWRRVRAARSSRVSACIFFMSVGRQDFVSPYSTFRILRARHIDEASELQDGCTAMARRRPSYALPLSRAVKTRCQASERRYLAPCP
jgi:hypothetical protein